MKFKKITKKDDDEDDMNEWIESDMNEIDE